MKSPRPDRPATRQSSLLATARRGRRIALAIAVLSLAACSESVYVIDRHDADRLATLSARQRGQATVPVRSFATGAPGRVRADALVLDPTLVSRTPDGIVARTHGVHRLTGLGLGVIATGLILTAVGAVAVVGESTHFPQRDLPCRDGAGSSAPWQCSFHDGWGTAPGWTVVGLGLGNVAAGGLLVAIGLGRDPALEAGRPQLAFAAH